MVTPDEAIDNATRLLQAAEGETDRSLLESWTRLAEAWTAIAVVVMESA